MQLKEKLWISSIILWILLSIFRISNCFLWKSQNYLLKNLSNLINELWNANLLVILWISKKKLWHANFVLRISNLLLWNSKFNVSNAKNNLQNSNLLHINSKLKLYITNVKFFHLIFSNSNITLCYFTERVWLLKLKFGVQKIKFEIQRIIFEFERIFLVVKE